MSQHLSESPEPATDQKKQFAMIDGQDINRLTRKAQRIVTDGNENYVLRTYDFNTRTITVDTTPFETGAAKRKTTTFLISQAPDAIQDEAEELEDKMHALPAHLAAEGFYGETFYRLWPPAGELAGDARYYHFYESAAQFITNDLRDSETVPFTALPRSEVMEARTRLLDYKDTAVIATPESH